MRARTLSLSVTFLLLLAACGGSGSATVDQPVSSEVEAVESDALAQTPDPDGNETGNETDQISTNSASDGALDAEFDPNSAGQVIDDLVTEASVDGDVTGEELTEILEVAGTPTNQASCEGDLLASLGITDPTDIDALRIAATEITEEQRAQLSTCIGGAGG